MVNSAKRSPLVCSELEQKVQLTPKLGRLLLQTKLVLKRSGQRGDNFIQVAHDTVTREFEDRRFGVFVNRHNDFATAHARLMLYRSADPAGNV